ncbi:MAG: FtsX-like permease family protein [Acidimicrobiales bacterium]
MSARRAVVRWAWRMFRREWRQQLLVLGLLTVAVGATTAGTTAVYSTVATPDLAEFGTANHVLRFAGPDPADLRAKATAAVEWFDDVDVIANWSAPIPGSPDRLAFRAQDPDGAFSGPMLASVEGRYPSDVGEVAVTDEVGQTFELTIGSILEADGVERVVVGMVENPSDLETEFALVPPDDTTQAESMTLLTRASDDQVQAFPVSGPGIDEVEVGARADGDSVVAATSTLGVSTIALVLVGLIAITSFVVVAQRRLRQLGMLAAIGASEKHLRLVMVANGAVVGAVAAVVGTALGLAGWIAAVPRLETAAGFRIDRFDAPWGLVAAASLLAVATATGAAWWPARTAASIPPTHALSGRPMRPRSVRRSGLLAGLLVAAGITALVWADQRNSLVVSVGTVATVLGVLLVAPLAVRTIAHAASRSPVAVRLGLRNLARYQTRSSAALAAISLTVGIPVVVVVTAAAAAHGADEGNLTASQLLVRMGNPNEPDGPCPGPVQFAAGGPLGGGSGPCPFLQERPATEHDRLEADVDRIVATLDGEPTVHPLDVAVDPAVEPDRHGQQAVTLARDLGDTGLVDVSLLWVATPDMLGRYGLELDAVGPDTEVVTLETGELWLAGFLNPASGDHQPERLARTARITRSYTSLPGTFITPDALGQRGWEAARAGWLVETSGAISEDDYEAARRLAASSGLIVESRDRQEGLASLQARATLVGMVLALVVLALAVGLIRSEATGDLQTLTAAGATSGIRRALTATTSGSLALLGVLLGTGGAYVALAAGYLRDLDDLHPVPILHLGLIAVGVPLAATAAGWLLGGREPDRFARALEQVVS